MMTCEASPFLFERPHKKLIEARCRDSELWGWVKPKGKEQSDGGDVAKGGGLRDAYPYPFLCWVSFHSLKQNSSRAGELNC